MVRSRRRPEGRRRERRSSPGPRSRPIPSAPAAARSVGTSGTCCPRPGPGVNASVPVAFPQLDLGAGVDDQDPSRFQHPGELGEDLPVTRIAVRLRVLQMVHHLVDEHGIHRRRTQGKRRDRRLREPDPTRFRGVGVASLAPSAASPARDPPPRPASRGLGARPSSCRCRTRHRPPPIPAAEVRSAPGSRG